MGFLRSLFSKDNNDYYDILPIVMPGVPKEKYKGVGKQKALAAAKIFVSQKERILQDSIKLVNETCNPEVFFSRFDVVLRILSQFESIENSLNGVFSQNGPTVVEQKQKILLAWPEAQKDFFDRWEKSIADQLIKLKTTKGRTNRLEKACTEIDEFKEKIEDIVKEYYEEKILYLKENLPDIELVVTQNLIESNEEKKHELVQISPEKFINTYVVDYPIINTMPGDFNWWIKVSFGKSTSSNYTKAVKLAKLSNHYEEISDNCDITHVATYSDKREDFLAFIILYDVVNSWKSTFYSINGEMVDKVTIGKIKYCYGDKCRSIKSSFCYGASIFTENPFGCHRLQISQYNNPWWEYYVEDSSEFIFDRVAFNDRVERTFNTFKYCPAFNIKEIKRIGDMIPNRLSTQQYKEILDIVNRSRLALHI